MKNGGYHFHGMIKGCPSDLFIEYTKKDYTFPLTLPYKLINQLQMGKKIYHLEFFDKKLGYNTFSKIRNREACSNYIMKYITKNCCRTSENQIYFCSRGLTRPEVIEIEPNLDFDFKKSYENDYCKIWDYNTINLSHKYLLDIIMSYKM